MSTVVEMLFDSETQLYVFPCPHCHLDISVLSKDINCKIFRHGVIKATGLQLNPHASKLECDQLSQTNQIYGCEKPFKFDGFKVEVCNYI